MHIISCPMNVTLFFIAFISIYWQKQEKIRSLGVYLIPITAELI